MIGETIRTLRKNENLTLEELANKLNKIYPDTVNFNKGKLSKWENGKEEPKLSSLKILADYFDVSIDDIIYDAQLKQVAKTFQEISDNASVIRADIYKTYIKAFTQLNEKGVTELFNYAKYLANQDQYRSKDITLEVGGKEIESSDFDIIIKRKEK